MGKNKFIIVILLIAAISVSTFTSCAATDSPTTQIMISFSPPAVRSEAGLARAMQGDYSDVFNPFGGGDPNTELAQERIQYSRLGTSVCYYHPKQHPEQAKLGAIYIYDEWITFGYTSTDPKNKAPKTGESFNITWYTNPSFALTHFENWKNVLPDLVESDDKRGYFYKYSEMPCSETDDIDKMYTILWMQDGYCFMAHMPARYGLERILELCDMEAVDITAQQ